MDLETAKELQELKKDEISCLKERERQANRMAFLLKGGMGQDIKDVTSGKIKVKLSRKERFKYFINKLFSIF